MFDTVNPILFGVFGWHVLNSYEKGCKKILKPMEKNNLFAREYFCFAKKVIMRIIIMKI